MRKQVNIIFILLAVLGTGFVFWYNREKVQDYFVKKDLPKAQTFDQVVEEKKTNVIKVEPEITTDEKPVEADPEPEVEIKLSSSINLAVPFQPQAPYADWVMPYKEACEETSIIMVDHYLRGDDLSPAQTKSEIDEQVAWQFQEWGGHYDIPIAQTAELAEQFYDYETLIIPNLTKEKIKQQLNLGRPVIIPAAGRELGNPYFTPPGPYYHMLVVKGYHDGSFITNDPGTRRGADFLYPEDSLMDAISDYDQDFPNGAKVGLVLYKNSTVSKTSFNTCRADSDCMLVQEDYCKAIIGINKSSYDTWYAEDQERSVASKASQQTCEPSLSEYSDIANYTVSCYQGICTSNYAK